MRRALTKYHNKQKSLEIKDPNKEFVFSANPTLEYSFYGEVIK